MTMAFESLISARLPCKTSGECPRPRAATGSEVVDQPHIRL